MQDIYETQKELENDSYCAVADFEKELSKKGSNDLTAFCESNAEKIISKWWNLSEMLSSNTITASLQLRITSCMKSIIPKTGLKMLVTMKVQSVMKQGNR